VIRSAKGSDIESQGTAEPSGQSNDLAGLSGRNEERLRFELVDNTNTKMGREILEVFAEGEGTA